MSSLNLVGKKSRREKKQNLLPLPSPNSVMKRSPEKHHTIQHNTIHHNPPRTHKQVSWPYCTLKITSTASQITHCSLAPLTRLTPFTPPVFFVVVVVVLFCCLLQMIIRRKRTGHLQMIIWRICPLANDHPEDPASCK